MRTPSLFLLLFLLSAQRGFTQSAALWRACSNRPALSADVAERTSLPSKYLLFDLESSEMLQLLTQAPAEGSGKKEVEVALPQPDGTLRTFLVHRTQMMAPELAARYPAIQTYKGTATDGSGAVACLGTGYQGFYSYIFEPDHSIVAIRSYGDAEKAPLMVYWSKDEGTEPAAFGPRIRCGTDDFGGANNDDLYKKVQQQAIQERGIVPVKLRKYRIAIAAKGEYTAFHGGTKAVALAAITTSLNFINTIFERDLALRLELVANNDLLLYTDANTDPYTGNLASDWMSQNTDVLNTIIGPTNYDIGHIYGVYIQGTAVGVARRGGVCDLQDKSKGSSSERQPVGTRFNLVAAHEMCHQFSGSHTWNNCTDDILGQRESSTAFEPGSGSTIMGYPGSCLSNNVVSANDDYFHVGSIDQVRVFTTTGNGRLCGSEQTVSNNPPELTILHQNGFFIPRSTPFVLKARATDADGDTNLTYCWEQFDLGDTIDLGKQKNGNQPLFRSFDPVASGERSFPARTNVFNILGVAVPKVTNELLPDRARDLSFRCTVRDNKPGGGGVTYEQLKFKVADGTGPFIVTEPVANTVWTVGGYHDVKWNVANTDKAPVNCKTVNIWLSTSGPTGFNIRLAENLPNSGSACIRVPDRVSSIARVLVEAADNVFYDINPGVIRIQQPAQPGFDICVGLGADLACLPRTYKATISSGSFLNFSDPVALSASGLPTGATVRFSKSAITPGESVEAEITFAENTPEGSYDIKLIGTSGSLTAETTTRLTVVSNNFTNLTLTDPPNGTINGGVTALKWNTVPDGVTYEVQLSESASFDPLTASSNTLTTGTWNIPVALASSKIYYWRVRGINECGPGEWTEPFFFATPIQNCTTLVATDLPKAISASTLNTVESKIEFGESGTLTDVNILYMRGTHNFFRDLDVRLIAPGGQSTTLFANMCGLPAIFNFGFDGSAINPLTCPPTQTGPFRPSGNLGTLNGTDAKGTWTLRVRDNSAGSGGSLNEFSLQLCFGVSIQNPFVVVNNTLSLNSGTNAPVTAALLKADDANNTAAQLRFTLLTVPKKGELRLNGTPLKQGDSFTQADIDNGALRYYENGSGGKDQFRFIVTDGEGGFVSDTFQIESIVSAFETSQNRLAFEVAPNPATDQLVIDFGAPLSGDTHLALLDMSGRVITTAVMQSDNVLYVLPLPVLPAGVYMLRAQNEKGQGIRKIAIRL